MTKGSAPNSSPPQVYKYNRPLSQDIISAVIGILCIFGFFSGWAGSSDKPIYMLWLVALPIAAFSMLRVVLRFAKPSMIQLTDDAIVFPGIVGSKRIPFSDIESIEDKELRGGKRFLLIRSNGKYVGYLMSSNLENIESYNAIHRTLKGNSQS